MCTAAKVVLVPGVWFDDSPLDVPCCEFLRSTYLIMASRCSYSLNSWCYDAARFKRLFLLDRPICPLRVSGTVSECGKDYSERYTLLHPYFIAVNEKYLWSEAEFTPNSALCQKLLTPSDLASDTLFEPLKDIDLTSVPLKIVASIVKLCPLLSASVTFMLLQCISVSDPTCIQGWGVLVFVLEALSPPPSSSSGFY